MRMNLRVWLLAAALAAAGCGGDDSGGPAFISFSSTTLGCPDDSLTLTIDGGFTADPTVSFVMGDTSYDGDPVLLDDGSVVCGLPADAAPGDYNVIVNGNNAGIVTLASMTCN